MRFSAIKKPLAMLIVISLIGSVALMAVIGASGQQQGEETYQGPSEGGGYAIPGLPGVSLGPGTNTIALSASIASYKGDQVFFQVNSFAVMDQQTQAFNVYDLSSAMPGIMDTGNNRVQIDIAKLESSIQSTTQASQDDLYRTLRPSVNSLMVIAQVTQQDEAGSRASFQVQSLHVIMPDGQDNEFDMSQPMSVVVDGAAMRIFASGFSQVYDLVNTYIVNLQNNYYTEINYTIVTGPVVVVSPPVIYPVLTPIVFPSIWPVYYPVPVPVPIPVATEKPPPVKPTKKPTVSPKVSPTGKPTVSPKVSPTVSPTGKPTGKPTVSPKVSPTVSPTGKPTGKPSGKPTVSPKISPTGKPTGKPSGKPTGVITAKPTTKGPIGPSPVGTKKPVITGKPTKMPVTTKKPVGTLKPGGGGGAPTHKPVTTIKAPTGGGGFKPTIKAPVGGGGKPVVTMKATPGGMKPGGGGHRTVEGGIATSLGMYLPWATPVASPTCGPTITPTRII